VRAACVEAPGLASVGGVLRLVRLLRRERADVVHTHLRGPNLVGQVAATLAGTPVRLAHLRNMDARDTLVSRSTDRLVARLATRMIAVSPLVARQRMEQAGIAPGRIVTILNAIDLEVFKAIDRDRARAGLGIRPDEVVFGYSGRLHPRKRIDVLIRAAARALPEVPGLRLLLAGDGEDRAGLERLAAETGLGGRVAFLGECREMPPVYSAMDVFCLVSQAEGCSRALLEAAACALPLIATPVGFAPDMLEAREATGILVPVDAEEPLARAMVRLGRDAELRGRMGAAARELALRHDIRKHVDEVEQLYLTLWSEAAGHG
jgi:glycosyltransferase involved in cell wall biosynthesis